MRQAIHDIVAGVTPFDATEASHQRQALAWIQSGAPLFRTAKPDIPPMHLVSYFALYDRVANKLMLIDHVKAKVWVPTGGHVDPDEHPRDTVMREAKEELAIEVSFVPPLDDRPLFITTTVTKGFGSHTDVSLWYVVRGDSAAALAFDPKEMHGYQWLTPNEILSIDINQLDPHMHRFVRKMQKAVL